MSSQDIAADTSALIIAALQSHFRAKRDSAVANLSVYVNNPAGVGDHADLMKECTTLIEQISSAEDCLRVVNKLFVRKD